MVLTPIEGPVAEDAPGSPRAPRRIDASQLSRSSSNASQLSTADEVLQMLQQPPELRHGNDLGADLPPGVQSLPRRVAGLDRSHATHVGVRVLRVRLRPLQDGDFVLLSGLQGAKELNGKFGQVVESWT